MFFIWKYHVKNQFPGFLKILISRLKILVKLVMDLNVDQEHSHRSVLLVKEEELLIFDKDQCRSKWVVVLVLVKEW